MKSCTTKFNASVSANCQAQNREGSDLANLSAHELFFKYQYLVKYVINKHFSQIDRSEREDMVQWGNEGLLRACNKYKPEYNEARFVSYAKISIRGTICQYLSDVLDDVSFTEEGARDIRKLRYKYPELKSAYEGRNEKPEVWDDFLNTTQVSADVAKAYYMAKADTCALDANTFNSEDDSQVEMLHDDYSVEKEVMAAELAEKSHLLYENILKTLSDKEREMLMGVIINETISQAEVARQQNVTRSEINRKIKKINERLSRLPEARKLLALRQQQDDLYISRDYSLS